MTELLTDLKLLSYFKREQLSTNQVPEVISAEEDYSA
jgi:hypothetical protein